MSQLEGFVLGGTSIKAMSYNSQKIMLNPDLSVRAQPSMLQAGGGSTDSRPSGSIEVGLGGGVGFYYEGAKHDEIWDYWQGDFIITNNLEIPVRIVATHFIIGNGYGVFYSLPIVSGVREYFQSVLGSFFGDITKDGWISPNGRVSISGVRIPYYVLFSSLRLYYFFVDRAGGVYSRTLDLPMTQPVKRQSLGLAPVDVIARDKLYTNSTVGVMDYFSSIGSPFISYLGGGGRVEIDYSVPSLKLSLGRASEKTKLTLGPFYTVNFSFETNTFVLRVRNNTQRPLRVVWFDVFNRNSFGWVSCNPTSKPMNHSDFVRYFLPSGTLGGSLFLPGQEGHLEFNWASSYLELSPTFLWAFVTVDLGGLLSYSSIEVST